MILLITDKQIDKIWNKMTLGLSRAEFPDLCGSVYTVDHLYSLIKDEGHLGFYQVESGYAGVMRVSQKLHKKYLFVYFGGQDITNPNPVNFEEMDEFFLEVAKTFGCKYIQVQGRRGWERKVKHLGYSLETINIFKEVT